MFEKPQKQLTYILRCWEEQKGNAAHETVWRFTLKDPNSSKKYGFPTIHALVEFLEAQMNS